MIPKILHTVTSTYISNTKSSYHISYTENNPTVLSNTIKSHNRMTEIIINVSKQ